MQGYSVADAAALLNVAEGTVKSRCARGRARLAVLLCALSPPREGTLGRCPRLRPAYGHRPTRGKATHAARPAPPPARLIATIATAGAVLLAASVSGAWALLGRPVPPGAPRRAPNSSPCRPRTPLTAPAGTPRLPCCLTTVPRHRGQCPLGRGCNDRRNPARRHRHRIRPGRLHRGDLHRTCRTQTTRLRGNLIRRCADDHHRGRELPGFRAGIMAPS